MEFQGWRVFCSLFGCVLLCILASTGCGVGGDVYPSPTSSVVGTLHPLVAQYDLTIPQKNATAWVEFGTDTTYGRQTSASVPTTGFGEPISILVAGMLPGTTYHMRAHIDESGGTETWVDQDRTFTTGAIAQRLSSDPPLVLPNLMVTRPTPNLTPSSGVELLDLLPPNSTHNLSALVTDLQGNIIWYYDVGQGEIPFPYKLLFNGHIGVNVGINPLKGSATSALREIDLAGNTISELPLSQVNQGLQAQGYGFSVEGFHHDFLWLPNGHRILIAFVYKNFTDLPGYPGITNVQGDALVDVDTGGNVTWAWSAFDHLDVNRHPMNFPDWTHSNAILYTPNDGNLLLSMRHQSWIIKIDYENGNGPGDILWHLGYQGDFSLAGGDDSQWFYAQHFPAIHSIVGSQITLTAFDNGDDRVVDDKGDVCGMPGTQSCYSRATMFQFDESTRSASLAWEYAPGYYSFWGGGTQELSNGDIEFDMSQAFPQNPGSSQAMEVTQTSNPEIVWQIDIPGADAYRAYRIPSLYPGVTWQQ